MKKLFGIFTLAVSLTLATTSYAINSTQPVDGGSRPTLAPMLKKILPAVVNVSILGQIPASKLPAGVYPRNQFVPSPAGPSLQFVSVGSGVVIDAKKGYIITNAHVLKDAKTIAVTLSDGRRLRARIVGQDKATDIAVIQIDASNLTQIEFAQANSLKVGDYVAAIGNPYGLHQSVTSGLVSALNRELGIDGAIGYESFIQTDAPINPGNSGGALVNIQGQLVGINTGIISQSGGSVGIGFAIPANLAHSIAAQLIKYGKITHGILGVLVQVLNPDLADALNASNAQGVLVTQVNPGSEAERAGIKAKDIIQNINGEAIQTPNQLRYIVGITPIGDKLTIQLLRDGKSSTVTATVGNPNKAGKPSTKKINLIAGISLKDIEILDQNLGYIKGLQVLGVDYKSAAWLAGLAPGDVILSANNQPIQSIPDFLKIANNSKTLLLQIQRDNGRSYIAVTPADEDVSNTESISSGDASSNNDDFDGDDQ